MPRRQPRPLPSAADFATLNRLPVTAFDAAALSWSIRFSGDAIQSALDADQLFRAPPPIWAEAREDLSAYFALGKPSHALRLSPHVWADFHEPQITSGFVHFVTSGPHKADRIIALLRAAGFSESDLATAEITGTAAQAEARTDTGERIDILAYAQTPRGRYGVIIEAKFGHSLSKKQLRVYEVAASELHRLGTRRRRRLIVVAPKYSSKISRPLQGDPEWRFVSWERLLVRYEAALEAAADSEDFARFRRTIWHRSGHGRGL
jgi:hypothetical protein